jgi:hypothetical protein
MNTPGVGFRFFWIACVMGAGLGIFYDFLRPLRPKHTHTADLLFVAGAAYSWLWLSFGFCDGDIRIGYWSGLILGGIAWVHTLGRWVRPVFAVFWKFLLAPIVFLKNIFKKTGKKAKIFFASGKKSSTIRKERLRTKEDTPNGKMDVHTAASPFGAPFQFPSYKNRGFRQRIAVPAGPSDDAGPSVRHPKKERRTAGSRRRAGAGQRTVDRLH